MKTESDIKHALSIFYISTSPPPKMTTLYQSGRFKQEAAFFHWCVWRLVYRRKKCFENSVTIQKQIMTYSKALNNVISWKCSLEGRLSTLYLDKNRT